MKKNDLVNFGAFADKIEEVSAFQMFNGQAFKTELFAMTMVAEINQSDGIWLLITDDPPVVDGKQLYLIRKIFK